ncbi:MAG TPA: hypothetical protein VFY14_03935 [Streptomyces sp.]|nr:hypothetical protein [Streptomyces sp.]
MNRYLEDAARVLKNLEERIDKGVSVNDRPRVLLDIARGYANLAAIDKGLIPADVIEDVIRAVADRR